MPNESKKNFIQTVLGPVDPREWGPTDAHSHLVRLGGPLVEDDRRFLLASIDKALEELAAFRKAGGRAMVDMTPTSPGRCVERLVEISRRSNVHVVVATGFIEWALYPAGKDWLENTDVEALALLLAEEIREGTDRNNYTGPVVQRTEARAGVIKVSTGYQVITSFQEKCNRAAAMAHRMTGAPVSAHMEKGTCAIELMESLQKEGVPTDAISLAHILLNPDLEYLKEIAAAGTYLILDGPGKTHYAPDSQIVHLVEGLVAAGFQDRLMLAADHSKNSYWKSYGGGPGFDYVFSRFVPRLRETGIPESAISAMLSENAARALQMR